MHQAHKYYIPVTVNDAKMSIRQMMASIVKTSNRPTAMDKMTTTTRLMVMTKVTTRPTRLMFPPARAASSIRGVGSTKPRE